MTGDVHVEGSATVYRLYDIGYAIDLERAANSLGEQHRRRVRPERLEARAFEIRNPPLLVSLGEFDFSGSGDEHVMLGDNTGEDGVELAFTSIRVEPVDAPPPPEMTSGCGCQSGGGGAAAAGCALVGFAVIGGRRRRQGMQA